MNAARFDFTSDYMIFFGAMLFVLIIIAVAMERASPRRQQRRKIRRTTGDATAGDLID
ncbi:hypothetical protein [Sphingomonas radiodurans]|uniref:hypothetical protein n=1 Tax=Sphingomonas radiodurans TaxID=2890321 RepID=UPI001E33C48B|nr:hypothetical protein [Sphingomonas radiodurans]WBH16071.1 hypothetical protein LLW23_14855 [Sphingomonas radiodurans]